jgi:hypothetical protein
MLKIASGEHGRRSQLKIFVNYVGYEKNGKKRAVVEAPANSGLEEFNLVNEENDETVFNGKIHNAGHVDNWKNWNFWTLDFSDFSGTGFFYISIKLGEREWRSRSFEIAENILQEKTLSDVLFYFKSQRCSGKYDRADRNAPFFGSRKDRVDVHGGWYDAAGDFSKHLSHLSYANYMNPQQTPLVVWGLVDSLGRLLQYNPSTAENLKDRLIEEALYGADFLMRMLDREGYFYENVFDGLSHRPDRREICGIINLGPGRHEKTDRYQAGYREGGGVAIAALARASTLGESSDYKSEEYLEGAIKAFDHLEEKNVDYVKDGKENIIDDYCALLAASELFNAAGEKRFVQAARKRARSLLNRISSDLNYSGWWRADDKGERPFYHAAEAGLPVVSLVRFLEVDKGSPLREEVLKTIRISLEFELKITEEVVNPFGYARQYVKPVGKSPRTSFFMPHENETGYWWQGENGRIASLAAAAYRASILFKKDKVFCEKLEKYASDQLNWILGLNPFGVCMLHGFGRNPPDHHPKFRNAPGGIVNGITAGLHDEMDIDFLPHSTETPYRHTWRWVEQWIVHAIWFFIAVCSKEKI